MNVSLEKYLVNSGLDVKDAYEIRQIFQFVTDEKKLNILNNFPYIVASIKAMKADMRSEQEILLGKTLGNIETAVKGYKTSGITLSTHADIQVLKTKL